MIHDLETITSLIMFGLSVISWMWIYIAKLSKMELKIDTLWEFMMRRAKGEAIQLKLVDVNSPFFINEAGYQAIRHMVPDMMEFFRKSKYKIGTVDLTMAIEREFGDRLLKEVCVPNNMSVGACLVLAIKALTGEIVALSH